MRSWYIWSLYYAYNLQHYLIYSSYCSYTLYFFYLNVQIEVSLSFLLTMQYLFTMTKYRRAFSCYIANFSHRWLPFTSFSLRQYLKNFVLDFCGTWIVVLHVVPVHQIQCHMFIMHCPFIVRVYTFWSLCNLGPFSKALKYLVLFYNHIDGATFVNCDFKWNIYIYIIFIDYEELNFWKWFCA